ncbi:B12-binding domain-containing radical SAM protein [Reyranella sp.]|uniref:B12-binding domain-containing radical SAM protein n=1 Tax=Reyranella sp. TaxID=1929291 RepID=UPI002731B18E|nr:B12-binding domain-containing radical SAM protein [Reyranella sp.]MDP2377712.1 B12-binding domain-containing radical SAM protein [Reyranella sp.]
MSTGQCNVLLVSPQFPVATFWNNKSTCKVGGARHSAIPLGLLTVAALLPASWTCRLVDRNVADVTEADLAWADLVMTGGMNVQRPDCLSLIARAQSRGKVVVVGGPDATSEPDFYAHADFLVLGEAEVVIQDFIAAWDAGQRRGRFVAEKFKVDVTTTPVPRYDLLRRSDYLYLAVQFSRGCPFNCEFCDIIELYGRMPRVKTAAQMLAELEAIYRGGYRGHIDFVDDNFIGNKKAVKAFLPELIAWQKEHDYPFVFSTEASVNLADDDALLALMRKAGFFVVFVGIESPDGDTLVAMQKKQNARRSLTKSIHKIYGAGMFVIAGFIVGFDTEKGSIADGMVDCIEDADIAICMAGLLTALANTQLTTRLTRERRLFPATWQMERMGEGGGDQCILGLNFDPLRPRRDVLADYKGVIDRIYTPQAFFGRVTRAARKLDCFWPAKKAAAKPAWRVAGLTRGDWIALFRLLRSVVLEQPLLLGYYLKALHTCARENPGALQAVGTMAAFYLHLGPFSRVVSQAMARQIEDIDSGKWRSPVASLEAERAGKESLPWPGNAALQSRAGHRAHV